MNKKLLSFLLCVSLCSSCPSPAFAAQGPAAAFDDVPAGSWYADSVAWASRTGVVQGYDGNVFKPLDSITASCSRVMLSRGLNTFPS